MGEDKQQWIKETIVGPLVVAAITGGLVLGGGAWMRLSDLSHHFDQYDYRYTELHNRFDDLERKFENFRKPGGRFTASDGSRLERQINQLDQCCRSVNSQVGKLETQFEFFHRE